jgi:hypothetical protein
MHVTKKRIHNQTVIDNENYIFNLFQFKQLDRTNKSPIEH